MRLSIQFQKILALTPSSVSWRTKGLIAAAQLVGLQIDIPTQPPNSRHFIDAFAAQDGPRSWGSPRTTHPNLGSARAWLSHLDLLKFVVQSQYSTTLILEDDVDWDVRILEQMQHASEGLRSYFEPPQDVDIDAGRAPLANTTTQQIPRARNEDSRHPDPYSSRNWDVLWLGNCGEYLGSGSNHFTWPDDTVLPRNQYSGPIKAYSESYLPEHHRMAIYTSTSICTFGYAVTLSGAAKILEYLSAGNNEAFDVALQQACKEDGKLECLSVTPEIFHHYNLPAGAADPERGIGNLIEVVNAQTESATQSATHFSPEATDDEKGKITLSDDVLAKGFTPDIEKSARCMALYGRECRDPKIDYR